MSDSDCDELPPEAVPLPELGAAEASKIPPAGSKPAKEEAEESEEDAAAADGAAQQSLDPRPSAPPPQPQPQPPARLPPVPVTLITGFLGAGKSTLVRHLLSAKHGLRLAVILNEFGSERGLEADLLSAGAAAAAVPRRLRETGGGENGEEANNTNAAAAAPVALEDWVELSNGCLCCSAKSGFLSALEGLLAKTAREEEEGEARRQRQRRQQQSNAADAAPSSSSPPVPPRRRRRPLDGILVETSGLADPGPAATALWADEALEASAALGGVVAVVDAGRLIAQLRARRAPGTVNEAARQLAYADVVLVNKVDTLRRKKEEEEEEEEEKERGEKKKNEKTGNSSSLPPSLEEVVAEIRAINYEARIVPCERSAVDPRLLLSVRTVGKEGGLASEKEEVEEGAGEGSLGGLGGLGIGGRSAAAPPPSLPAPRHDPGITTTSWRSPGVAASEERLRAWLERALWRDDSESGGGGERGGGGDRGGGEKGAGEEEDAEEEEELEIFRLKGLVCLPPNDSALDAAAEGEERGGGGGGGGNGAEGREKISSFRKVVVQAVADTYDLLEAGPWPGGDVNDPFLARFVAIGRGLKGRRGRELVREFEEEVMGKV